MGRTRAPRSAPTRCWWPMRRPGGCRPRRCGRPPAGSSPSSAAWRPGGSDMPRQLILIDHPRERLTGEETFHPGYPRPYTPDEMRAWAQDLERCYATPPGSLERWRQLDPEQLTLEQRRVLAVHDHYFTEPD